MFFDDASAPPAQTIELKCPRCDGYNLHHQAVIIFDRSEDAETVIRTEVFAGRASVSAIPSDGSGNPSRRRDGIVVRFSCETCGTDDQIELTIAQHKGSTEVGWRL